MATGSYTSERTGNLYIDGLLSGYNWDQLNLTYGFPQDTSVYEASYNNPGPKTEFAPVSASMRLAFEGFVQGTTSTGTPWMTLTPVAGFTNLTFQLANPAQSSTDILIGTTAYGNTAYASFPGDVYGQAAGDIWFGDENEFFYSNPTVGSRGYETALHELGHALGLKHGHEAGYPEDVVLPKERDYREFTVMTYNGSVLSAAAAAGNGGHSDGGAEQLASGSISEINVDHPQTFMMLDIAALQHLYGANFSFRNTNTTYSWSPTTGEAFVNGVGQGKPGSGLVGGAKANKILQTIWDGGGTDTYDLSNYNTDLSLDLFPGAHSLFSAAQRAGYGRGNVYNALLYNSDPRSLIENARGGTGNDSIKGNSANNHLAGNAGNDVLLGGLGNDTLDGGAGSDTAVFSGSKVDYSIVHNADGTLTVADGKVGRDGTDLLRDVRFLQFSDQKMMLGNTAPSSLKLKTASVSENLLPTTIVSKLIAMDADGDNLKFRLTSNSGGYFKIDGDNLVLAKSLDYEARKQHKITLLASDPYGLSVKKTLTIKVKNTGDALSVTLKGDNKSGTLKGRSGNDKLYGLDGKDVLSGGSGNDKLYGGKGVDKLTGGAGQDIFVFDTPVADKFFRDQITDFSVKNDTIHLSRKIFSKLGKKGVLSKEVFHTGTWETLDKDDRIAYDSKTGIVTYFARGSEAAGDAAQIAKLDKNLKLTHLDFYVI